MRLTARLPLPPTNNHRLLPVVRHGRVRLITGPKMRAWKDEVAGLLERSEGLGSEPVTVAIAIAFPDKRRRDIDGPVKPILDALVDAGWFDDDSQVESLTVRKFQPWMEDEVDPGQVLVSVRPWPPF